MFKTGIMKKTLIILVTLLLIQKIKCQNAYVPMPMQNCEWQVSNQANCTWLNNPGTSAESYTIYPGNDTIIATKRYIKFYVTDTYTISGAGCVSQTKTTGYWGAVRQDTAAQKIYVKLSAGNEVLYYNFNLHKGDTMKTYLGYPNPIPYQIIDSVYYQSFSDGICRRVYLFKYPSNWNYNNSNYVFYNKVIEGIGFNTGFDNTVSSMNSSSANVTQAFSNSLKINGQTILVASSNPCAQTSGWKENTIEIDLKIFPNPANEVITISSSLNHAHLHFIIRDILGNEILVSEKATINVKDLKSGVYFITTVGQNNKTTVSKFIKN